MRKVEFEVHGCVPPRNVRPPSMWNNPTEIPRVMKLRKSALSAIRGRKPFSKDIKLAIEILVPRSHNKPGDLDNFIKGICDSLYKPVKSLENENFEPNEIFRRPENEDVHPSKFEVIDDDGQIVKIHATMAVVESEDWFYSITVEGD
ncbi:MAG: hypothetical protein E3J35_06390 [Methanomassiliicoccales archaeon]|nr:MAG: hypothetical protein E3J35_06390 [Methanomassiliicoccales archaeon]